jgi:hypothetical protein
LFLALHAEKVQNAIEFKQPINKQRHVKIGFPGFYLLAQ